MGHFLDLDTWSRKSLFLFFKTYDQPFFQICAPLPVGPTHQWCKQTDTSYFLATWYCCLRAINDVAAFRYRMRGEQVWVHDTIDIGTTVLLDDESFTFCYFDHAETFQRFAPAAQNRLDALKQGQKNLDPRKDRDDFIYGSVIPWIPFTSIAHARRLDALDSAPKITFGKYHQQGDQLVMPVSVEAHHALMDALHVARFFERFTHYLERPETWLQTRA